MFIFLFDQEMSESVSYYRSKYTVYLFWENFNSCRDQLKGMKNELKHVTFTGAFEAFKCSGDKDSLPLGNDQMLFIVFKSNVVKLVNTTSQKTWLTYLLSAPLLSFSHF